MTDQQNQLKRPRIGHTCHATGCNCIIRPHLLMCPRHWSMVPTELQVALSKHYRQGQVKAKELSKEQQDAADKAIKAVRDTEIKRAVERNSAKSAKKAQKPPRPRLKTNR